MKKYFLFILVIIFFGCSSSNSSIKNDPNQQYSHISVAENISITRFDGKNRFNLRKGGDIIPGIHTLVVNYAVGNTGTNPVTIEYNFEANKKYKIKYEFINPEKDLYYAGGLIVKNIKVFIEELE